jgi:hypothetical protein
LRSPVYEYTPLNQREIDHLVTLKQLRKTIEASLMKDLAEDVGRPVPGPLPSDTATVTPTAFRGNEKLAAIAEAEVLLSSLMRSINPFQRRPAEDWSAEPPAAE